VSSDGDHILDTVVLLYFLLVDRVDLLGDLIGRPLRVPLAVYDPLEDPRPGSSAARPEFLSEMRQAVAHYRNRAANDADDAEALRRLGQIDRLYASGALVSIVMDAEERRLSAILEGSQCSEYGLKAPLGPGEAACVAISHRRGWTLVTDDADGLRAGSRLRGDAFEYERIRKLLIRAADEQHVSQEEANRIHTAMTQHGFWDSVLPFP